MPGFAAEALVRSRWANKGSYRSLVNYFGPTLLTCLSRPGVGCRSPPGRLLARLVAVSGPGISRDIPCQRRYRHLSRCPGRRARAHGVATRDRLSQADWTNGGGRKAVRCRDGAKRRYGEAAR
jgi:hypothetical protein